MNRAHATTVLSAVVLWSAFGPSPAIAATPVEVRALDPGGPPRWSVVLEADAGVEGSPIVAQEWFPRIPPSSLDPLEVGGSVPDEPSGVTLLDFWASWCEPCLVELPHLQSIHDRLRGDGLRTVAVNVDDPAPVARATAERLGLTVEIARASDALTRAVRPRSLPTLLLIDDGGRIRRRWNGYRAGVEVEVEREARALLAAAATIPTRTLGRAVGPGSEAYVVRWARGLEGDVRGVAVEDRDGGARVLAAVRDDLVAIDDSGAFAGRAPAPDGTGRVRLADVTGDGRPEVIGWRPGAARIGVLDLAERAATTWESGGPVLGLAVAPGRPDGSPASIVLATTSGLFLHAADGSPVAAIEGAARDVAVDPDPAPGVGAVAFLDDEGDLVRVGTAGEEPRISEAFSAARRIVGADRGLVAASGTATLLVASRASRVADPILVVVSGSDLWVVAARDGSTRWHSTWAAPVRSVAVDDLDGDGSDEIVVAAGEDVVVLERRGR